MKRVIITASRRDDIIRRRDEYDRKQANNNAIRDQQRKSFGVDRDRVFAEIENELRTRLGDKIGELIINVTTRYGAIDVRIGNDIGGPRHDPNAALTWSWEAMLDENGEVKKESSSWSGLSAVTPAQIQDLKQSVEQLEIINNMDWKNLLDVSLPNWEDYVDDSMIEELGPRPDFDTELLEAELEDGTGQNVLFLSNTSGKTFRNRVYYQILRDSNTQYTVTEVSANVVDDILAGGTYGDITTVADYVEREGSTYRIKKTSLINLLVKPVQTLRF